MITLKCIRKFSTSSVVYGQHYKVLVCGGGTGGTAMSNKMSRKVGKDNVAIIEPSSDHYCQPMFTLVGGGFKQLEETRRNTKDLLPKGVKWYRDSVAEILPQENTVKTSGGDVITYDYLIVAMGLRLRYDLIPGLEEGLQHCPSVTSNYSPKYVSKTYRAIQNFKGGNAIFTFPDTLIKCPGAPQKIMYVFDDYCRQNNLRDQTKIHYNSSLAVIFAAPVYAKVLWKLSQEKGCNVNFRTNLISIDHTRRRAVFENLDTHERQTFPFDFIHVTPPQEGHAVLASSDLTDDSGWMSVDHGTLQHVKYNNVFGIGDCTDAPTSKTAAGVSSQSGVVFRNLCNVMDGKPLSDKKYEGYTACPLVTGKGKVILAEFDYSLKPVETFPINQKKEKLSFYYLKTLLFPLLYWHGLLKGYFSGPAIYRKLFTLGLKKN